MKMNMLKGTESIVDMAQVPKISDILDQLQAMGTKQIIGFYAVAFGLTTIEEQMLIADDSIEGEFKVVGDDKTEG